MAPVLGKRREKGGAVVTEVTCEAVWYNSQAFYGERERGKDERNAGTEESIGVDGLKQSESVATGLRYAVVGEKVM